MLGSCQPPEVPSLITERFDCLPLCVEREKETVPSKYTQILTRFFLNHKISDLLTVKSPA